MQLRRTAKDAIDATKRTLSTSVVIATAAVVIAALALIVALLK